jgi:hypothetical protein
MRNAGQSCFVAKHSGRMRYRAQTPKSFKIIAVGHRAKTSTSRTCGRIPRKVIQPALQAFRAGGAA